MVTINFIRDKEVGLFARAKRLNKGVKAPTAVDVKHAIARSEPRTPSDVEDSASDSGISICAKRRNASGSSLASDEKD
jgi:hypothetical protein